MKGKLIVIDGTDCVGKETQSKMLVKNLKQKGYNTKYISFPRYQHPASYFIRQYLHEKKYGDWTEVGAKTASYFFALDRYDAKGEMYKDLEQGMILVCDRYVSANMGHQGCKINSIQERKDFYEWLYQLEFLRLRIPKPDLNLILFTPVNISEKLRKKRGKPEDIHEQDPIHQNKSSQVFIEIAQMFSGFNLIHCANKNSMLPKEQIQTKILDKVKKILD